MQSNKNDDSQKLQQPKFEIKNKVSENIYIDDEKNQKLTMDIQGSIDKLDSQDNIKTTDSKTTHFASEVQSHQTIENNSVIAKSQEAEESVLTHNKSSAPVSPAASTIYEIYNNKEANTTEEINAVHLDEDNHRYTNIAVEETDSFPVSSKKIRSNESELDDETSVSSAITINSKTKNSIPTGIDPNSIHFNESEGMVSAWSKANPEILDDDLEATVYSKSKNYNHEDERGNESEWPTYQEPESIMDPNITILFEEKQKEYEAQRSLLLDLLQEERLKYDEKLASLFLRLKEKDVLLSSVVKMLQEYRRNYEGVCHGVISAAVDVRNKQKMRLNLIGKRPLDYSNIFEQVSNNLPQSKPNTAGLSSSRNVTKNHILTPVTIPCTGETIIARLPGSCNVPVDSKRVGSAKTKSLDVEALLSKPFFEHPAIMTKSTNGKRKGNNIEDSIKEMLKQQFYDRQSPLRKEKGVKLKSNSKRIAFTLKQAS